jgi:hypothetical protein
VPGERLLPGLLIAASFASALAMQLMADPAARALHSRADPFVGNTLRPDGCGMVVWSPLLRTAGTLHPDILQSERIGPLVPHLDTWTTATVPRDWAAPNATIYLCYPLQQLTAAGPLLSALLAALLRGQMAQPVRQPTLFAIDELPAVGLHNLTEYLATVGSAGVTVLFYTRALTQLAVVYGEAGAQTILGNCHHQLYYPPRDLATAEQISAVFGTALALTRSGGRGTRGARESIHEVVRAALEPAQALALPEDAVVALTLLGSRQYRLIGQRLDLRRTFPHLPPAPTPPKVSGEYGGAGRPARR